MCIRDRPGDDGAQPPGAGKAASGGEPCLIDTSTSSGCRACLLYTSDAADDLLCVDLGGRSIIKKKNN